MTIPAMLVVGPAWVGDMVMAQALFKTLEQQHPDVAIDVLAPEWSAPLLQRMPEVRRVIPMPLSHGQLGLMTRYRLGKALRKKQYQKVIVLPNSFKSALIPFFAKIPKRVGWKRELRYGLLNDLRVLDKTRYPQMIQRFIALAYPKGAPLSERLPKPRLVCDKANVLKAKQKYGLLNNHPILALCPGAEFGSSKRWPEQYYAQVAVQKIKEGWSVWIMGSKNDQIVADRIQAMTGVQCHDLTGKTTLAEAIDLLSAATVVVTNDSGLMHIAAAVRTPLVAVYGSTDSSFTPPLSKKAVIVENTLACRPCFKRECPLQHHRCMQDVQPFRVLEALKQWEPVCES